MLLVVFSDKRPSLCFAFMIVQAVVASLSAMFAILQVLGRLIVDVFRPRIRLEAENLFLRHQLTIAMPYREPKTVDEDLRIG